MTKQPLYDIELQEKQDKNENHTGELIRMNPKIKPFRTKIK